MFDGFPPIFPTDFAFRSSAVTGVGAGGVVAKPSGLAVGDILIVVAPTTSSSGATLTTGGGGGAWPRNEIVWATGGYMSVVFAKIATALDVSQTWTLTDLNRAVSAAWVGEGATGVVVRGTAANPLSQSTLTISGYTPVNSKGSIAIAVDRDTDSAMTAPTGFMSRLFAIAGDGNFGVRVVDRVDHTGAAVTFTGMLGPVYGYPEVGWVLEVQGS